MAETKFPSVIDPQNKAAVFASTAPFQADRLLWSLVASSGAPTHTSARHADVVMVFLDTRRALPHVKMARTLPMELPEQHADYHKNRDGKLLGHLVGVRGAVGTLS